MATKKPKKKFRGNLTYAIWQAAPLWVKIPTMPLMVIFSGIEFLGS